MVIITNSFRIIQTIIGAPIEDFIAAGLVHSVTIFIEQLIPLNLAFAIFWITNISQEHQLKHQAMTDCLTTLYNRAAIFSLAEKEIERIKRHKGSIGIAIADIDFFKSVNDNYGHLVGDKVLYELAQVLKMNVRASDLVGRYGGEEFILIFPDITSEQLFQLTDNLRQILENTKINADEHTISVTFSFGATIMSEESYSLNNHIKIADQLLYQAKSEGRNRVVLR